MKSPLLKQEWVNIPLSIPKEWREFFDQATAVLGGSRNSSLCLALRLGGPILGKYIDTMRSELKRQYQAIGRTPENPSFDFTEILGPPGKPAFSGKKVGDERKRANKRRSAGSEESSGS